MDAPAVAVSNDGKKVAAAWMDMRAGKNDRDVQWTVGSAGKFAPESTVHWTSRSFFPARMSIQAAANFLPSLLTATAGASMGQLSTLLSPWLIRATFANDAPPFVESAIISARFAFLPPSR